MTDITLNQLMHVIVLWNQFRIKDQRKAFLCFKTENEGILCIGLNIQG